MNNDKVIFHIWEIKVHLFSTILNAAKKKTNYEPLTIMLTWFSIQNTL